MNNISVYNLENYLPLYIIDNYGRYSVRDGVLNKIATIESTLNEEITEIIKDIIIDNMETTEDSECPAWVNKQIKLGEFGEKIVLNYLVSLGLDVTQTSKIDSSAGYDIISNNTLYEVKTTINSDLKFFITYNELKVSNINKEDYNIFIVFIDNKEKTIRGLIINNPINVLDIDYVLLTQIYETPLASIFPNSFRVKIKEVLLNKFKYIDLTNYNY